HRTPNDFGKRYRVAVGNHRGDTKVAGRFAMVDDPSGHDRWARLRFAIVGPLLAAPPQRGELRRELQALAQKTWRHPISAEPVQFAFSTLERWFHQARAARRDPVGVLRRKVRRDAGDWRRLNARQRAVLATQHSAHPSWSCQLHADNLAARIAADPSLGDAPSYATVARYMKAAGLRRKKRL